MQPFLFAPLFFNVLADHLFISVFSHRACKISIRPGFSSPIPSSIAVIRYYDENTITRTGPTHDIQAIAAPATYVVSDDLALAKTWKIEQINQAANGHIKSQWSPTTPRNSMAIIVEILKTIAVAIAINSDYALFIIMTRTMKYCRMRLW
jgi:hypothetical protein